MREALPEFQCYWALISSSSILRFAPLPGGDTVSLREDHEGIRRKTCPIPDEGKKVEEGKDRYTGCSISFVYLTFSTKTDS